jgi:hypothetical protein
MAEIGRTVEEFTRQLKFWEIGGLCRWKDLARKHFETQACRLVVNIKEAVAYQLK